MGPRYWNRPPWNVALPPVNSPEPALLLTIGADWPPFQ